MMAEISPPAAGMAPMIMPEVEPMPPSISMTTNFVPLSVVKVVGATYCMTQV